jgi:hypothetical protein
MTPSAAKIKRPFVAAYWPVRVEPEEATVRRVTALLADLPDGPPWYLAAIDGSEEPLAWQPGALVEQFRQDAALQDIDAGILSSVIREGVALVKLALGHGQYGTSDSVVITFSQPFDPVAVLRAVVRRFEPDWAVCGSHELRSAQRPPRGSAPWLGPTTYLGGERDAPPGAVALRVGSGTIVDFTNRGRNEPDDAVILAAARRLIPPA